MPRGRPVESEIRQRIVELLYFLKEGYGYEIYKIYSKIFPRATQRSIYYHLRKGVQTKEFKVSKIKKEQGDYSWGSYAEKIYYALDKNAKPKIEKKVEKELKKLGALK